MMKRRCVFVFVALSIIISGSAVGAPVNPNIGDIYIPLIPIFPTDPCVLADAKADLTNLQEKNIQYGDGYGYYTSLVYWDITFTSPVSATGKVISRYSRLGYGSTAIVSTEDTIIVSGFTLFGRASNTQSGFYGARGVIIAAINNSNGQQIDIRGTYLYRETTGSGVEMCFFIE
jgi:hypothetical protein